MEASNLLVKEPMNHEEESTVNNQFTMYIGKKRSLVENNKKKSCSLCEHGFLIKLFLFMPCN